MVTCKLCNAIKYFSPSIYRNFVLSTTHATAVDVNAQRNVPQTLLKEHVEPLEAVACHPKQPLVAMGSHSGTIKVWDYEHKEAVCSRVFLPHKQIQCITYDPQGELENKTSLIL